MQICEIFRSLQGEGLRMGAPTIFIRTIGCNLRCKWCDTGYAFEGGEEKSLEEILEKVDDTPDVCVTGGEPLLQSEMPQLLNLLLSRDKCVVLETNGSVDISNVPDNPKMIVSMDIKCPSSGMTDKMLMSNISLMKKKDQLKFVINGDEDFEFACNFLKEHDIQSTIIFSPVGGMNLEKLADCVVAKHINVRVLPQLHKIIWGDRKSV